MAKVSKLLIGCSVLTIMVTVSAPTQAQVATVRTQAAPESAISGGDTGDIIVTANKREQRLNDVGLTVAVVSGAALKDRQISSPADLALATPGLSFTNSSNGTPVYTLRGIGFYETSIGAYPTVSTYIDEAPLPFSALSSHSVFDLERVEVLKGPQGTLFGQNATGGAINYITAKPTDTFHAGFNGNYGRFNQLNGEFFVSGPLSDTLTARVSGKVERGDGWQVSNSRPDDRLGKLRNYMGRVLIAYKPTSGMRFLLDLNGWTDKSDPEAPQYVAVQPQHLLLDPAFAASPFSPKRPRAADWTDGLPFRDNRFLQATLRADIDILSNLTLTSLTSYGDYKQRQGEDGDGLAVKELDISSDLGRIKTFSQELRLSNGTHSTLRYVLGANYGHSSVNQEEAFEFSNSSSTATFGTFLGYPIGHDDYSTSQRFQDYAFFGNVEYDLLPTVTLKSGIRYTDARDSAHACTSDLSGLPRDTGAFVFDVELGGRFGTYAGQCASVNNLGVTNNGVAPGAPGSYASTLHENNVAYKFGIDWKPVPGILLYGNVAKGYKAGSFPTISASLFSQFQPVKQESLQSYEAGFKASVLDRTLQFNGAGFYYDYDNKQLESKVVDPIIGILDVLQNIPKSSVRGFEIELVMRPSRNLVVNTAFTYVDATIDKFSGVNAAGVDANFAGTRVPFTPKYQIGTNVDWDIPLTDRLNGFLGGSLNYRSDAVSIIGGDTNPPNASPQNFKIFNIASYATLDLRAGIKSADDRWRFSVYGKNVTNSYYWNNVVAAFDAITRYAAPPATYGVSFGYQF